MTHYATLDVDINADDTTIKLAFRKLAQKWHPDRNKAPDAEARFKAINDAAEVLLHPERRRQYNETGESNLPKPREIEVRNRAMACIQKALSGGDDIRVGALSVAQQELNQLTVKKQQCRAGVDMLRKKRERVKAKDENGLNLFHMVVDQAITNQEQMLEQLHAEDDLWTEVLALLQDYESVASMMTSLPRFHFGTSTSTSGY